MNFESKPQSLLTFRVGPVLCCAPSLPVRSIITPPKLTHPPGSDSSQPGIFKHGSHIVKVLDLRQKFGVEKAEQTQPGNFIITVFEKESFAFWVDQILDVFDFPSEGWSNLPAAIPRGVFSRTLLLKKKIHLYSEFEKLATINDLGYLKHYIQQLKQNLNQEINVAEKKEPSTSTLNNKTAKTTLEIKSVTTSKTENKPDEIKYSPTPEVNRIKPDKDKSKTAIVKKDKPHSTVKPVITSVSKTTKPTYPANSDKPPSNTRVNTARHATIPKKSKTSFSNKTTPSEKQSADESKTSYFGIILFFMFLVGVTGAGIYYLLLDDTKKSYKYKKEKIIISPKYNYEKKLNYDINENDNTDINSTSDNFITDSIENEEITLTNEHKIESSEKDSPYPVVKEKIEIEEVKQQELTPAQVITEEDSNTAEPEHLIKTDSDIPLFNAEPDPIDNQAYRAEITKLDNEITITLHQSALEEKLQPAKAAMSLKTIEDTNIDETISNSPSVEKLNQKELTKEISTKKIIQEVVHVVVKGDTLWAIAKKYVNNPFLYPELARLSNIKNPHRIYPGNRVRIRFVKN